MIPVTLPKNAVPGQQLSVMLPVMESNLPVAQEVNPSQVAPANQETNRPEWIFPANHGNFEAALSTCNNTVRVLDPVAASALR